MTDTLRDREIILAGGTGGLGTATAELLAAEGAHLTLSSGPDPVDERPRVWSNGSIDA